MPAIIVRHRSIWMLDSVCSLSPDCSRHCSGGPSGRLEGPLVGLYNWFSRRKLFFFFEQLLVFEIRIQLTFFFLDKFLFLER